MTIPESGIVPVGDIRTVFLDVGNTLISVDFDWIAFELCARGVACDGGTLRRAEAAARPGYSHRVFVAGVEPGTDLFRAYLSEILARAAIADDLADRDRDRLLAELRTVLRPGNQASALWRSVMPRVPDALARLRERGLRLVVVSNSDGTVERSLVDAGLRPFFDAVVDSAVVGYEKPDARIFHHALECSGSAPRRTLHVGDLYHADVVGARAAGIHALLLDPFGDWTDVDCASVTDVWALADLFDSPAVE